MQIKKIIFSLFILIGLTACSNNYSVSPFKINKNEKIYINSTKDKNYKKVFFLINSIKLDYIDSLKKIEYFNMPQSEIPALNHNLIWIAGPDPTLSRDMFHIKKYADNNLMIEGFGLKDKISYVFKKIYNIEDPNSKAKKIGFNNFKEMFNVVFERVSNENTKTLIENLIQLRKKHIINTNTIFTTVNAFKRKLNKFIFYSNEEYFYYMFGNKTNNIDTIKIINEGNFYILNKFKEPIYFESKDYEIYMLTLDICYELIKKEQGGKGIDVL